MIQHLPKRPPSAGPVVFLVDDDPRRRYLVASLLRAEGIEVLSAAGHEPLFEVFASCLNIPATWVSLVASVAPDAALVDLAGEGAVVTVGALRRHALTAQVPVIAYGGRRQECQAAMSMGVEMALGEGLETELADVVRDVLEVIAEESVSRRAGASCA